MLTEFEAGHCRVFENIVLKEFLEAGQPSRGSLRGYEASDRRVGNLHTYSSPSQQSWTRPSCARVHEPSFTSLRLACHIGFGLILSLTG